MDRSVSLTLSTDDYVAANQLHFRDSLRRPSGLACFALPVLAYLILMTMAYFQRWETALVVAVNAGAAFFVAFIVANYFVFTPVTTRRNYGKQKTLHRPYTFAWSETGLRISSDSGEGHLAWSDFLKWREDARIFVFYQGPRLFNMLPKRVLTPEQIADLHQCAGRIVE